MNRLKVLVAIAAVLVVILVVVLLVNRTGSTPRVPFEVPKALAFECTQCTYKFGVPVRQNVWPPLKCPKCSGEAVQLSILQPRDGGEPEVVRYERFSREQIAAMRAYRDGLLLEEHGEERLQEMPPDAWIVAEDGLGGRWIRYAQIPNSPWISPQQAMSMEGSTEMIEQQIRTKYKLVPVFPEDWPIEENVESLY